MNKKIIKIGDILVIDSAALQPAEILLDEEDLFGKTIIVDNELYVRDENKNHLGATLIFKYVGHGKFKEMMTGKIYLSDGFSDCEEYELEDKTALIFEDNKKYENNEEFQKDFYLLKENCLVISTKNDYIFELNDESKSLYLHNTDDVRLKTISVLEQRAKEIFEESVNHLINRDSELASLDNDIENFKHR